MYMIVFSMKHFVFTTVSKRYSSNHKYTILVTASQSSNELKYPLTHNHMPNTKDVIGIVIYTTGSYFG